MPKQQRFYPSSNRLFRAGATLFLCVAITGLTPTLAHAQGAVASLRRLLDSGRVPPERQGQILEMICTRGEPDDLAVPFNMLNKPGALSAEHKRKVIEL